MEGILGYSIVHLPTIFLADRAFEDGVYPKLYRPGQAPSYLLTNFQDIMKLPDQPRSPSGVFVGLFTQVEDSLKQGFGTLAANDTTVTSESFSSNANAIRSRILQPKKNSRRR